MQVNHQKRASQIVTHCKKCSSKIYIFVLKRAQLFSSGCWKKWANKMSWGPTKENKKSCILEDSNPKKQCKLWDRKKRIWVPWSSPQPWTKGNSTLCCINKNITWLSRVGCMWVALQEDFHRKLLISSSQISYTSLYFLFTVFVIGASGMFFQKGGFVFLLEPFIQHLALWYGISSIPGQQSITLITVKREEKNASL